MNNNLVKKGYEKAAESYLAARDRYKNNKWLDKFNKLLNPNSLILDLGCGAGVPIDEYFINKGHRIIGIDIAEKQIELAKKSVPQGKFKVEDFSELKENEYSVDAVISFYAIFHTKRETHQELFRKINSFLPSGGFILVSMGASEWEGTEQFHGADIFWSHFGKDENLKIIKKADFEILFEDVDQSGGEKHLMVIARK